MTYIFWLSLFFIFYLFHGYKYALDTLIFFYGKKTSLRHENYYPTITVLLTVFNEEKGIVNKLNDLLKQDYPDNKYNIVVASDRSTDNTESLVRSYKDSKVRLFSPKKSTGKSDTQNQAIRTIKSEIIVFTDCDTRFKEDCISKLISPYINKKVGCTTGELHLITSSQDNNITENHSRYWAYEMQLRRKESDLGILAIATGACMSVRRDVFTPFSATYGEDCIVPLDVVLKGGQVKHIKEAIAFDNMPSTQNGELNTRIRMTLRNWQGTWAKSELLNPFKHPVIAYALWSHKILRWFSPIFIIFLTLSSFFLSFVNSFYLISSSFLVAFYVIGIYGFLTDEKGESMPSIINTIYSFFLANLGFFIGLWLSLTGKSISRYKL